MASDTIGSAVEIPESPSGAACNIYCNPCDPVRAPGRKGYTCQRRKTACNIYYSERKSEFTQLPILGLDRGCVV